MPPPSLASTSSVKARKGIKTGAAQQMTRGLKIDLGAACPAHKRARLGDAMRPKIPKKKVKEDEVNPVALSALDGRAIMASHQLIIE